MNCWALAFEYEEEVYWDFEKEDKTKVLSETCFLPTKAMAEKYIAEEISELFMPVGFVPVRIDIRINGGKIVHHRRRVDAWDGDD